MRLVVRWTSRDAEMAVLTCSIIAFCVVQGVCSVLVLMMVGDFLFDPVWRGAPWWMVELPSACLAGVCFFCQWWIGRLGKQRAALREGLNGS